MSYTLDRCHASAIRHTVEADHYLRRWPDPRSLPFGYHLVENGRTQASDGRPLGLLVFKKLQHHRQLGLFGYAGLPTAWQVLDLARVWVHPDLQSVTWKGHDRSGREVLMRRNDFSRMIGIALKRVQRDWLEHHPPVFPELPYHILRIISYCDRAHHHGIGYRAAGFEFLGPSADGTKDVYLKRLKTPPWEYVTSPNLFQGIAA